MSATDQRLSNEVVARLANWTGAQGGGDWAAGLLAREVQERRAAEAKWEAILQTVNCPTCGGDGCFHEEQVMPGGDVGEVIVGKCPDCTDGHPPMEKVLTVGAAAIVALAERDRAYAARENGDVANWKAMKAVEAAVRP